MFTGIIEELGKVKAIQVLPDAIRLTIEGPLVVSDVNRGDSISVSGACLTAVEIEGKRFTADVMNETLRLTNLGDLKVGDKVNLERAAQLVADWCRRAAGRRRSRASSWVRWASSPMPSAPARPPGPTPSAASRCPPRPAPRSRQNRKLQRRHRQSVQHLLHPAPKQVPSHMCLQLSSNQLLQRRKFPQHFRSRQIVEPSVQRY